jgi:Domain of unknown function (DUF4365)
VERHSGPPLPDPGGEDAPANGCGVPWPCCWHGQPARTAARRHPTLGPTRRHPHGGIAWRTRLELKATDQVRRVVDGKFIAYRLSRADLQSWLTQFLPVILVVYDGRADRAYWLYVQAYFEKLPGFHLKRAGETATVRIPITNLLGPGAIRIFAHYRDRILVQMEGQVTHEE